MCFFIIVIQNILHLVYCSFTLHKKSSSKEIPFLYTPSHILATMNTISNYPLCVFLTNLQLFLKESYLCLINWSLRWMPLLYCTSSCLVLALSCGMNWKQVHLTWHNTINGPGTFYINCWFVFLSFLVGLQLNHGGKIKRSLTGSLNYCTLSQEIFFSE